jgi:dGTPase
MMGILHLASGEKAIGEYFSIGNGKKYKDQLTAKEWQDLIDFEGNAMVLLF